MTGQALVGEKPALIQLIVLEHERPLLVRVTTQANRAYAAGQLDRLRSIQRAVLLMTIAAIHGAFRDFVMKRTGKLCFDFAVAVEAQGWRLLPQDIRMSGFLMRVVTVVTGHRVYVVLVLLKAALAETFFLVTARAHGHNVPGRGFTWIENSDRPAACFDVLFARSVTHFAPFCGRDKLLAFDGGEVRCA